MEVDLVFSTVANRTYLSTNRTKAKRDSFLAEIQIIKDQARQKTPDLKTVMHLSYMACPVLLTIFPLLTIVSFQAFPPPPPPHPPPLQPVFLFGQMGSLQPTE